MYCRGSKPNEDPKHNIMRHAADEALVILTIVARLIIQQPTAALTRRYAVRIPMLCP